MTYKTSQASNRDTPPSNASTSTKAGSPKGERSIPEELFDRAVRYIDGPMNARMEKLMKSRLLLAPVGIGVTLTCRAIIAVRDRRVGALFGRTDAR